MASALDMIVEGDSKKDPYLNEKDVGVFKTSEKSGNVGVVDFGDRSKAYTIDLDNINALTVLDIKENQAFKDIASMGQDGKRFQNKELGLIDNESGEVDAELIELIKVAALGETDSIQLGKIESGAVEILVAGDWSTDVLRFEGDQLNEVLASLSDIPAICEALPTLLDLKNKDSQIAVYDYEDDKDKGFVGNDADVDSSAVKAIIGGSKLELDEAAALVNYALSDDGQNDDGIEIDFNGSAFIVNITTRGGTVVDTLVLKGDALFDEIGNKVIGNGGEQDGLDMKNAVSQTAFFDYDEANSFFFGSDSFVDSKDAKDILGGSRMDSGEAEGLVELALAGDPNVRYLAGDEDSAIIQVDAGGDSVDTLIITGDDFNFV